MWKIRGDAGGIVDEFGDDRAEDWDDGFLHEEVLEFEKVRRGVEDEEEIMDGTIILAFNLCEQFYGEINESIKSNPWRL